MKKIIQFINILDFISILGKNCVYLYEISGIPFNVRKLHDYIYIEIDGILFLTFHISTISTDTVYNTLKRYTIVMGESSNTTWYLSDTKDSTEQKQHKQLYLKDNIDSLQYNILYDSNIIEAYELINEVEKQIYYTQMHVIGFTIEQKGLTKFLGCDIL